MIIGSQHLPSAAYLHSLVSLFVHIELDVFVITVSNCVLTSKALQGGKAASAHLCCQFTILRHIPLSSHDQRLITLSQELTNPVQLAYSSELIPTTI